MPLDLESPMDSSPKGSADNHSIDKGDNDEEETQDGLAETLHVLNQIKSYMNKRFVSTLSFSINHSQISKHFTVLLFVN